MWLLQLNSEFQAYKHIECMEPGELMRASSPLEAIIGMHPTLILTNALPYDIQVTVWQVRPVLCTLENTMDASTWSKDYELVRTVWSCLDRQLRHLI